MGRGWYIEGFILMGASLLLLNLGLFLVTIPLLSIILSIIGAAGFVMVGLIMLWHWMEA